MKANRLMIFFLSLIVCVYAYGQVPQPTGSFAIDRVLIVSTGSIANGQTVSAAIQVKGYSLVGIQLPAAFTGTALTFQVSLDGTTYQLLKSTTSGSSLSYTVAQGTYVAIDPTPFYGARYIKIVSGTAEGAARTLALALKGI